MGFHALAGPSLSGDLRRCLIFTAKARRGPYKRLGRARSEVKRAFGREKTPFPLLLYSSSPCGGTSERGKAAGFSLQPFPGRELIFVISRGLSYSIMGIEQLLLNMMEISLCIKATVANI